MTIGTKEHYLNEFKHTLMTNLGVDDAQSLTSVHDYYAKQIDAMATLNTDEKNNYLHNLEKAFTDILHEIVGQPDE